MTIFLIIIALTISAVLSFAVGMVIYSNDPIRAIEASIRSGAAKFFFDSELAAIHARIDALEAVISTDAKSVGAKVKRK